MPFIAYKITHKESGKSYIGITTQKLHERWNSHVKAKDTYLSRSIRKHGRHAFDIEHIASCRTIDDLRAVEIVLIQQHNTMRPAGYNCHPGGEITQHTAETIERMRLSQANRSAEWRQKISIGLIGHIKSEETRRKLAYKKSDAQKQKIAATLRGSKSSMEKRRKQSASIKLWWADRKSADGQMGLAL